MKQKSIVVSVVSFCSVSFCSVSLSVVQLWGYINFFFLVVLLVWGIPPPSSPPHSPSPPPCLVTRARWNQVLTPAACVSALVSQMLQSVARKSRSEVWAHTRPRRGEVRPVKGESGVMEAGVRCLRASNYQLVKGCLDRKKKQLNLMLRLDWNS